MPINLNVVFKVAVMINRKVRLALKGINQGAVAVLKVDVFSL